MKGKIALFLFLFSITVANATLGNFTQYITANINNPLSTVATNTTFEVILNSTYAPYFNSTCGDIAVIDQQGNNMSFGVYLCHQDLTKYAETNDSTHLLIWNMTWASGNTTLEIYFNSSSSPVYATPLNSTNNIVLRYENFEDGVIDRESGGIPCVVDITSKLIGVKSMLCSGSTGMTSNVFNFSGKTTGNVTAQFFLKHNTSTTTCGLITGFMDSSGNWLKPLYHSGVVDASQCNFIGWVYYDGSFHAYPAPAPPNLNTGLRFFQFFFSNTTTERLGENLTYYGNISTATAGAYKFFIGPATTSKTHTFYIDELVIYNSLNNTAYTVYLSGVNNVSSSTSITFSNNVQTPSDLTTFNAFGTLNLSINTTDSLNNTNTSSAKVFLAINQSFNPNAGWKYENGVAYPFWANYSMNNATGNGISLQFSKTLYDNQYLPATYNINESLMEATSHNSSFSIYGNNLAEVRLRNYTNVSSTHILEFMAQNNSATSNDLIIYLCNNSYSGVITTSSNCAVLTTMPAGTAYNHTHSAYSSHITVPYSLNASGYFNGIKATDTMFIIFRSTAMLSSDGWTLSGISAVTDSGNAQTSATLGVTWAAFSGTFDSHEHAYKNDTTLLYYYQIYANNGTTAYNSSVYSDAFNLTSEPPTHVLITSPEVHSIYAINSTIPINWSAANSPVGRSITYNITLLEANGAYNSTINSSLSSTGYSWNTTSLNLANGRGFIIQIIAIDSAGETSITSMEDYFTIIDSIAYISPVSSLETLNKTQTFSYIVNPPLNATVRLFVDGSNVFTDYANETLTFSHDYAVSTYGAHSWYVSVNYTDDTIQTAPTQTFTVYFNLTQVSPPDLSQVILGNTIPLIYETINYYPINCSLYYDSVLNNNRNIDYSSDTNINITSTSGTHTWYVNCTAIDNPSYSKQTAIRTYYTSLPQNFTYYAAIANITEYITTAPQTIFYDINGNLNLLYYTIDTSNIQYVNVRTIQNGTSIAHYSGQLNQTKPFFVVFREVGQTTILAYSLNNVTGHLIKLDDSGGLSIYNFTTPYNVASNSYYDSFTYANTKWLTEDTIDLVEYESFYIFWLPTNNASWLMKKFVNNDTVFMLKNASSGVGRDPKIAWETLAVNANLTTWSYPMPKYFSYGATGTDYVTIYNYYANGSSIENVTPDITNKYNSTNIVKIAYTFDRSDDKTYSVLSNATTNAGNYIYQLEGAYKYTPSQNITNPSHLFFVDKNTLVMFSTEGTATYAYSCYFDSSANCLRLTSANYGLTVPYLRTSLTTHKLDGTSDTVTNGMMITSSMVTLAYNQYTYDVKFLCYDEQEETRKAFAVQIYSNDTAVVLTNSSWGYVVPSSELGSGIKKAYSHCTNGTVRLFFVGLDSGFALDFYSLLTSEGAYYAYTVKNSFGQPMEGARISAYRFSINKQAWVVIEQGITDYTGSATLFLQPSQLYKIIIEQDGYVTLDFDFIPAGVTSISITMNTAGGTVNHMSSYDFMFDDVSFLVTPEFSSTTNATNITYTVSSATSRLQEWGMQITKDYNGTRTVVYFNNLSDPSGGSMEYEATENGTYYIDVWFDHMDHSHYTPLTKTLSITPLSSFLSARELFNSEQPIGGWAFYMIGVVCAMLAAGFASRYTIEGASIVGLAVLWGFALFNPGAILVCIAGIGGVCLTPITATIITTVMVIATVYVMKVGL